MKNLIFMIPLALITAIFIDGKSQSDIKYLTVEHLKLIDSIELNSKSKLPKLYYLDTSIKSNIDTLLNELKKTDELSNQLKNI